MMLAWLSKAWSQRYSESEGKGEIGGSRVSSACGGMGMSAGERKMKGKDPGLVRTDQSKGIRR